MKPGDFEQVSAPQGSSSRVGVSHQEEFEEAKDLPDMEKKAVVGEVMALDDVPGVVKARQGDSGREVDAVPRVLPAHSSVLACSHRVVLGASEASRRR